MKDPKKREKFFIFMTFAPIVANALIVIGMIIFILKLIAVI
jgi:hypothetical protein